MNPDEREYIAAYKDYAEAHLPEVETLAGLWSPDFDEKAYPDLDFISALRAYLNELNPYCSMLKRASGLRQQHYELFIQNRKAEDDAHRAWREGMNSIASDCEEKSAYWTSIHDRALIELINTQELEEAKAAKRKLKLDLTARNVDLEERQKRVQPKSFNPKSIVARPRLSEAEKNRRKNEHRAFVKARREAEDKILEEAIEDSGNLQLNVLDRFTIDRSQERKTIVTTAEFLDRIKALHLGNSIKWMAVTDFTDFVLFLEWLETIKLETNMKGLAEIFGYLFAGAFRLDATRKDGDDVPRNVTVYKLFWNRFTKLDLPFYQMLLQYITMYRATSLPHWKFIDYGGSMSFIMACILHRLPESTILDFAAMLLKSPITNEKAMMGPILIVRANSFYLVAANELLWSKLSYAGVKRFSIFFPEAYVHPPRDLLLEQVHRVLIPDYNGPLQDLIDEWLELVQEHKAILLRGPP